MTAQPTSAAARREAADAIKSNRDAVLVAFRVHGPGTSAEVLHRAGLAENLNLMRARVTELADEGLIVEDISRRCTVTGRRAIVWEQQRPREKFRNVELTAADIEAARGALAGAATHLRPDASALLRKIVAASEAK